MNDHNYYERYWRRMMQNYRSAFIIGAIVAAILYLLEKFGIL